MEPQEIIALRKRLGLTQTQLGERLGVGKMAVSHWEHGQCRPAKSVMLLIKLLGLQETAIDSEVVVK